MEEEVKKVDLITLLRTFKKEGLDNFIVIRKEKFENNFIPKSKVEEKIEEYKKVIEITKEQLKYEENVDVRRRHTITIEQVTAGILVLQELLERSREDEF